MASPRKARRFIYRDVDAISVDAIIHVRVLMPVFILGKVFGNRRNRGY